MSYLSGIYLKSWFSWFGGGSQKTLKKRRKQTEEKQKKEKRRMQRKSKNNNKHLWFYLLYKKVYVARKHSLKKSSLYHHILLQFLCVVGYLKRSNDTPNLNIHKYTNYNMIEIYIIRLSTTTQIFRTIDYLILMSEKYFNFRKRQKHVARKFFSYPVEVNGSVYLGNAFRIMRISKICTKPWSKLK